MAPEDPEDPDDWRTGTAERPAVPPPPPPLPPAPSSARFPLYADEAPPALAPQRPRPHQHVHRSARSGLLLALVTGAVLLAVALGGAALLLTDGDGDRHGDGSGGGGEPRDRRSTPATPSERAGGPEETEAVDLAARATADVPATAPASTDVDGAETRYTADRMLDGDPATAWRMPGDGTGSEITFTLPEPVELRSVGLVNGYAKTATGPGGRVLDWYAGNRRVLAVEWVLDDGTTVAQDLVEEPRPQTVRVDRVTTSTVVLRLREVSRPGDGPAARDFTAVSEAFLVGTPAQVG